MPIQGTTRNDPRSQGVALGYGEIGPTGRLQTHQKENVLKLKAVSLDVEERLVVLAASTITNPAAKLAVEKLPELHGCDVT